MSERKGLIIVKDPTTQDGLKRHLSWVIPEEFRKTPIIDIKDLKKSIKQATSIEFAIVDVFVPNWQEVIRNLSERGIRVYAHSWLNSTEKCGMAYSSGAMGFFTSVQETFSQIDKDLTNK